MKKKLLTSALSIFMIMAGSLTVNAFPGYVGGNSHHTMSSDDQSSEHHAQANHGQGKHQMNTKHLDLTEEQQDQIQQLRTDEVAQREELRDTIREYREQIMTLSAEVDFDEDAIRAVAEELSNAQVELAVAKARMNNNIQAIMSLEQLEITEELRLSGHHDLGQNHHGSDW